MAYPEILHVEVRDARGELWKCQLSDGSALVVTPAPQVDADDPCNWELITPGDLVLEVGPGSHWQIFDDTSP